jgi:hypothetical protein
MTGWPTVGIGLLIVGWVLQFVGHPWEGRKPAVIDDVADSPSDHCSSLSKPASFGMCKEIRLALKSSGAARRP